MKRDFSRRCAVDTQYKRCMMWKQAAKKQIKRWKDRSIKSNKSIQFKFARIEQNGRFSNVLLELYDFSKIKSSNFIISIVNMFSFSLLLHTLRRRIQMNVWYIFSLLHTLCFHCIDTRTECCKHYPCRFVQANRTYLENACIWANAF